MYSRDALRERNPWQGALTSIKRRANNAALGRRRRRRLREKLVQKCATRWKGPQALPTARPLQTDGEIACRPGEARRVRNPGYRMMPSSVALERADYANGCFKNHASAEKLCILLSVLCCQAHKASDSTVSAVLGHFGIEPSE